MSRRRKEPGQTETVIDECSQNHKRENVKQVVLQVETGMVGEIVSDYGLQIVGMLLGLASVAPWFWNPYHFNALAKYSICHPWLLDRCHEWRPWLREHAELVRLASYSNLALNLLCSFLFFLCVFRICSPTTKKTFIYIACWSLGLAHIIRYPLYLTDFTFRHNANYMISGCVIAFLLPTSGKRDSVRWFYLFCYFWAGTLKFDKDWLAGFPLDSLKWWPEPLRIPANIWAIILELFGSFALAFNEPFSYYFVFLNFIALHVISLFIVGWFYPTACAPLLAFFPVLRYFSPPIPEKESMWKRFISGRSSKWVYFIIIVLCLCNTAPKLIPGVKAFTGECRQLGLSMFDGNPRCSMRILALDKDGKKVSLVVGATDYPKYVDRVLIRPVACQAAASLSFLHHWCSDPKLHKEILLDPKTGRPFSAYLLHLMIHSNDVNEAPTVLLNISDACNTRYSYKFCGINRFIQPDRFNGSNWWADQVLAYGP